MEAGEEGVVTASDRVGVSHKGHTLLESTAPVLCEAENGHGLDVRGPKVWPGTWKTNFVPTDDW